MGLPECHSCQHVRPGSGTCGRRLEPGSRGNPAGLTGDTPRPRYPVTPPFARVRLLRPSIARHVTLLLVHPAPAFGDSRFVRCAYCMDWLMKLYPVSVQPHPTQEPDYVLPLGDRDRARSSVNDDRSMGAHHANTYNARVSHESLAAVAIRSRTCSGQKHKRRSTHDASSANPTRAKL
ncbi:hypothetical protein GW17_00023913 [Ensete ventricosum]|nr:hypothetical protein GW17_00023913 [Ensete ventricosum]